MKSFESYKYRANNLKIFGIALMTPFLAHLNTLLMTKEGFDDILYLRLFASFVFFVLGLKAIYQGMEILEKCDGKINLSYK